MVLLWKQVNNPQVYFEKCKYEIKKKKMIKFIDTELDLNDFDNSNDFNDSNSE